VASRKLKDLYIDYTEKYMAMRKIYAVILLLLVLGSCGRNTDSDLVITNGKIWTGNKQMPWAAWVSVKGGRDRVPRQEVMG
jgi:hypothetical protein